MKRVGAAAAVALCGVVALCAGTQVWRSPVRHDPITHRAIAGIATDAAWMDRASREAEEEPDKALAIIGIKRGMVVADIGAGSGYMTTRLARLTGSGGRVFANDIQPRLLQIVEQKAEAEHLSNVTVVAGSETSANLPDGVADLALLVDVYHEFSHPQDMIRSIRQVLKPDGRLVLVEHRKEDTTLPIADSHRLSVADARAEIEPERFTLDAVLDTLPRQHIIVFRRSESSR